jgi:hypothetical protein
MHPSRALDLAIGPGASCDPTRGALGAITAASPNAPLVLTGYGVRLNLQNASCQLRKAIVRAGLDGLGLTPAKIHRAVAKGLDRAAGGNLGGLSFAHLRTKSGFRWTSVNEKQMPMGKSRTKSSFGWTAISDSANQARQESLKSLVFLA